MTESRSGRLRPRSRHAEIPLSPVYFGLGVHPGQQAGERRTDQTELMSDGWTNVQVVRRGRLVMAMASKDGRTDVFEVDALTGRLWANDDDGDDD